MFSKEYVCTIHYLFVNSNNILAHGLEFRSIFLGSCDNPRPLKRHALLACSGSEFGIVLLFLLFFKRTSVGLLIAPCFRSRRAMSNGGLLLSVAYDLPSFIRFLIVINIA